MFFFYVVVCCGCGLHSEERNTIYKLIMKSGSIIGVTPESLDVVLEQRVGRKVKSIKQNGDHPMCVVSELESS